MTALPDPAAERPADFRCAAASLTRDESLVGTASTVRAFVAVEDPGPWGLRALVDSRLPEVVKAGLRGLERQRGVKVLLVRRPLGGSRGHDGVRVLVAHGVAAWLETTVLDDVADVLDLDLAGLSEGRSPGLEPVADPAYLVCTHGRHDACCAERGRPFARAVCRVAAEQTWEVSHVGGDRFAANALVLPHGLYYGRLTEERAETFAQEHRAGRLDLDHLRGRSRFPFPVQAAEIHLRRELGDRRIAAYRLRSAEREGTRTTATFDVDGRAWRVEVDSTPRAAELLTCRAAATSTAPHHRLLSATPL